MVGGRRRGDARTSADSVGRAGAVGTLAVVRPLPPDGGSDAAVGPRPRQASRSLDRRQFLQLSALGPPGWPAASRASPAPARSVRGPGPRTPHEHSPPSSTTTLPSGVVVPTAPWLIAENASPGTLNWICNHVQPDHALEGFASQVSAVPGDDVALFVNTTAQAVQVQAYRMGYYQGLGGRLVCQSDMVAARPQPRPIVTPGIGTVSCPWSPTMTLTVDQGLAARAATCSSWWATAVRSSSSRSPSATTPAWPPT